jgi:hypothetical protein
LRNVAANLLAISFPLLLMSGLTAYIVSSWLLVFLRAVGATKFSPRQYWACGMFGSTRGPAMMAGRLSRAVALSLFVPFWYALVFEYAGNADLPFGALLGLGHGVLVGITLPFIGRRQGCAKVPSPGLFGRRLGAATPLFLLLVYGLYGATLGYAYVVVTP